MILPLYFNYIIIKTFSATVTILTPATETELVIMNSEYLYTYVGTTYNTYISTDRGTAMWLPIIYMHMYLLTHILFLNGEKEIFWKCPLKRQLAIFQAIEYSTTVELIQTRLNSAYLFTWKKKYVHQMSFTIKETCISDHSFQ